MKEVLRRLAKGLPFLVLLLLISNLSVISQDSPPAVATPASQYYHVETEILDDGTSIDRNLINGPPSPPAGYERLAVELPQTDHAAGVATLAVPAYNWSFGCSPTSASMIAAYYDRTTYPDMYTGPTDGGVMPLKNDVWPDVVINGENRHQCPLSATRNGLDGRATRGHVDDYWIQFSATGPDPYVTNGWTEHAAGDCMADYMRTNKWFADRGFNSDGSTAFSYWTTGAPTYAADLEGAGAHGYDGGYGIKLFYESRGYGVDLMYNQYIQGVGDNPALGFTYAQYKAEIDAGRPVMIHLAGHTVVGIGYNDSSSDLLYIRDTWDYATHTMEWGTSYSGMDHRGVTIVRLDESPTLSWTGEVGYEADGLEPEVGYPTTTFAYRIKYSDADGDAPNYVRLHVHEGGVKIDGSPFEMNYVSGDYASGAIYEKSLSGLIGGTDYTYYFEAQDSRGSDATPTAEKDGPDVYEVLTIDHNPVTMATELTAVPIGAVVTGGSPPVTVTLSYRTTGDPGWITGMMPHLGDIYDLEIPFGYVTLAGVDYSITATDGTVTKTHPAVGHHHIEVSAPPVVDPPIYADQFIDDDDIGKSNGNGDGIVNCGETIELDVQLANPGVTTAVGVTGTISSTDSYITWFGNTSSSFGDIPGGASATSIDAFEFTIDPNAPDEHVLNFGLEMTATNGGPWTDAFTVTCLTPICSEGISNGGFETTSAWEIPATEYTAGYSTARAHGGSRSMRVGIVNAADNRYSYSSARQLVTIPAGDSSATLGFWLYQLSGETITGDLEIPEQPLASMPENAILEDDVQYVLILNQYDTWIDTLLWERRHATGWAYREFDLGDYEGETIKIQFGVYNDGYGGATGMYVDDVSLQICPPGAGNRPPDEPSDPSPGDGAKDQPVNLILTWTGGDPDGDAVTYDVYLEGVLLCDDVSVESCTPPTLGYDKQYEWYAVATDVHGASTPGPAWSFETVAGPDYEDWYLAEGYTGGGFETFILIQNSSALSASVEVTYMLEGGGTISKSLEVGPKSRHTILANDPGQVGPDLAFSTKVSADQPVMVERAMYWPNGPETVGGHGAVGIPEPGTTWYFAEGYTGASFQTFLLLQNPNEAPAVVDVQYMLAGGQVLSREHTVPAESRLTILANDPGQVGPDEAFSTKLVADRPIIAERAIYFDHEGHDAAGVMAPAKTWYLAEGYTGPGTETYILVQNPNASDATVEVAYMLEGGGTITRTHVVSATSRHTIVAHDAGEVGPDEAFAVELVSDLAVIVERAMYWPDGLGGLAGHGTMGATAAAKTWNLAEGYTGDGFTTYILVQNPNPAEATVEVTYMLAGGGTIVKTHHVGAESRHTIETHDPGEVGPGQTFATRLVSDLPIVVERAMYFSTGGHASGAVPE